MLLTPVPPISVTRRGFMGAPAGETGLQPSRPTAAPAEAAVTPAGSPAARRPPVTSHVTPDLASAAVGRPGNSAGATTGTAPADHGGPVSAGEATLPSPPQPLPGLMTPPRRHSARSQLSTAFQRSPLPLPLPPLPPPRLHRFCHCFHIMPPHNGPYATAQQRRPITVRPTT